MRFYIVCYYGENEVDFWPIFQDSPPVDKEVANRYAIGLNEDGVGPNGEHVSIFGPFDTPRSEDIDMIRMLDTFGMNAEPFLDESTITLIEGLIDALKVGDNLALMDNVTVDNGLSGFIVGCDDDMAFVQVNDGEAVPIHIYHLNRVGA